MREFCWMMASVGRRESALFRRAGFQHAFFTRRGGVSEGSYASLNLSSATGDSPQNVGENLARVAKVLGVPPAAVHMLSQVHGRTVHRLEADATSEQSAAIEADALVATGLKAACGIRTADCVPILIADRQTGAVAAAHAGWRGTVEGVLPATIEALRALVGAKGDLIAAIGPHISLGAFEVSQEVAAQLGALCDEVGVVQEFPGRNPHVSLSLILQRQLRDAGISQDCIDNIAGCTVSEPEHFFSFRRDGKASGRLLSAIVPRQ